MLYEYRRYEAVPGRMAALNARFRDITLHIWQKHGIKPVAFWEAHIGDSNVLHYMLQWDDMADRERRWNAFQQDQEWITARGKTEENGPLVAHIHNELWSPTAYSERALSGLIS